MLRRASPPIVLAAVLASAVAGCGRSPDVERVEAAALPVRVEQVRLAATADQYDAVGTVASKTVTVLASQVMGRVVAVRVSEGDRVRPGQVLVEIDGRDVAAQAARARAGVAEAEHALAEVDRSIRAAESGREAAEAGRHLAQVTHDRYRRLLEERSVSQQEYDEVEARYKTAAAEAARAGSMVEALQAKRRQTLSRIDQAKAESRGASVALGYSTIAAPFGGIVTQKSVEVGAMATPGMPLVTVENDAAYRLEASVEESFAAKVLLGAEVPVRIDALGDLALLGRVAEIAPSADPASRSVIVKIDLPAGGGLRSGLYGKASFPVGERQAVTVPRAAIVERGQMAGVYVVDEQGAAHLRFVTIGAALGDRVEVLSGIGDGERVVVDEVGRLSDGVRVSVTAAT
jgi:multidrug resistance efflux pump